MIREITLPEISEGAEAGTVVSVLVSEGDEIKQDDAIIELETDKATVEVPADQGGTVTEILVSSGDEVSVGQTILKLETDAESGEAADETQESGEAAEDADDESGEHESDEPKDGSAEDAPSKSRQGESTAEEEPDRGEGDSSPPAQRPGDRSGSGASVPAAPSTRRLARELGADITRIEGSGPGGRISKEDVKAHVRDSRGGGGGTSSAGSERSALPDFSKWGKTRRESMNGIRKATARNTQRSWQTIPHVTQFDEADLTALDEFRAEYSALAEDSGAKLTVTAILVKVVAEALRRFPRFNSSLDEDSNEVVIKEFINIGVAVDTDRGLMVPVIRDADTRSLIDIANQLADSATAVREGKAKPEEMQGGTFTISNLGGVAGTAFTPVVFHPQVAILGVARAKTAPILIDGTFEPRLVLPLSLSYDHRVLDGVDGARFLNWICRAVERPMFMHLQDTRLKGGSDGE